MALPVLDTHDDVALLIIEVMKTLRQVVLMKTVYSSEYLRDEVARIIAETIAVRRASLLHDSYDADIPPISTDPTTWDHSNPVVQYLVASGGSVYIGIAPGGQRVGVQIGRGTLEGLTTISRLIRTLRSIPRSL